ncbi:glycine cleavage system H protein [Allopseudospirillum japonicum]|uniref:Glycine cleavage system H protein n=1 Tax=Allopseudospirillum japonicum TaxID=64971 RepID=A0A1H6R5B5_9GAMM|nr:glycine cleavage system protein GcvH [Allopseudospirillum japonicum]SEI47707.1 glycine cleavage system H protein [Allopseudospirillum japonicum]
MSTSQLKYTTTHQWARLEEDGLVSVGITAFAQEELGDIVFAELPELGRQVQAGEQVAVVESVKTASEVYTPISGEVVVINEALNDAPERINDQPYTAWFFRLQASDLAELDALLDADAYQSLTQ